DQRAGGKVDVGGSFVAWRRPLRGGYERGYTSYAEVSTAGLRDARLQIERTLKSIAATLILAGAQVRGLSDDAAPPVACALLHGEILVGVEVARSPLWEERANDALIAVADWVADIPAASRAPFTDLYRLAFVLGVAQCYAEQLGLMSLATNS